MGIPARIMSFPCRPVLGVCCTALYSVETQKPYLNVLFPVLPCSYREVSLVYPAQDNSLDQWDSSPPHPLRPMPAAALDFHRAVRQLASNCARTLYKERRVFRAMLFRRHGYRLPKNNIFKRRRASCLQKKMRQHGDSNADHNNRCRYRSTIEFSRLTTGIPSSKKILRVRVHTILLCMTSLIVLTFLLE